MSNPSCIQIRPRCADTFKSLGKSYEEWREVEIYRRDALILWHSRNLRRLIKRYEDTPAEALDKMGDHMTLRESFEKRIRILENKIKRIRFDALNTKWDRDCYCTAANKY